MIRRLMCILGLSALLSACTGNDTEGPMPGTPAAILEKQASKWNAHAKRNFDFEVREDFPQDTTTYACESKDGKVGPCLKVSRCCGREERIDSVDTYSSPGEILARLRSELDKLDYDAAGSGSYNFHAQRRGANGAVEASLSAAFHSEFGYSLVISRFGTSVDSSGLAITRLEFK